MGSSGAVEHHRRPGKEFNGISGIGRAMDGGSYCVVGGGGLRTAPV